MKKIDLTCGDFLARILPDLGMNVVSLRYKGEPILCEIASRSSSPKPFSAAHVPLPAFLDSFRFMCYNFKYKVLCVGERCVGIWKKTETNVKAVLQQLL